MFSFQGMLLLIIINVYFSSCYNAMSPVIITMERSHVTCDKETILSCNTSVRKHNRTSPYLLNIFADIAKPLERDYSILFKSFEWKNNQYKESFMGFDKNLCDFLENDKWISNILKDVADMPRKCPLNKGHFVLKNFEFADDAFPSGFPVSKWKFVFSLILTQSKYTVGSFEIEFKVDQNLKANGKQ